MSSMRFKSRLHTSNYRLPHSFKISGAVTDSLTGINNAMKSLYDVNWRCIHNDFCVSSQVKSWGFKSGERGGYAVGLPPPFNLTWRLLQRTSSTARLQCAIAPSYTDHVIAVSVGGHLTVVLLDHVTGNLASVCVQLAAVKHTELANHHKSLLTL
jgi:hypothetical protein